MPQINIHDFDEFRTGEVIKAAASIIVTDFTKEVFSDLDEAMVAKAIEKIRALAAIEITKKSEPLPSDSILYAMAMIQAFMLSLGFATLPKSVLNAVSRGAANA